MTKHSRTQTELDHLKEVNSRSLPGRLFGYTRLSGPGWIQGALTLGASTATSSFYLGWKFGYEMLWVNILGMAMGVVMFAAIAHPTLFRETSIYRAMEKHVNPFLAFSWALAAIVTSVFWCMNQFAAATACLFDVGETAGWTDGVNESTAIKWGIGFLILVVSIPLTWTYASPRRTGVRIYESTLKIIVLFIVICFALIAWKTGIRWSDLLAGLIPNKLPSSPEDRTMVLGALGCAVGINMTFLFPITLRARSWGKHHLGLARFDLIWGMLLPFAVVSSLVVITTANVIHGSLERPDGPASVARVMAPLFEGSWFPAATGRILFDLGIAAMPLSSIMILMLISGLALCELLKVPHQGFWFKIGTVLPALGILGVTYKAPFWLGPLISSFALILLPIAYIGFLILCNSRSFLGDNLPRGNVRLAWNIGMILVALIAIVGASVKVMDALGALFGST